MNAPKRIFLQVCGDCPETDCSNCKFEDLEENVTWAKERIFEKDVEYIRTDTFIKKAENFFENYLEEEECKFGSSEWIEVRSDFESLDSLIRAFVNYIKGE